MGKCLCKAKTPLDLNDHQFNARSVSYLSDDGTPKPPKHESNTKPNKNESEHQTKNILSDQALCSRHAIKVAYRFWTDNVSVLTEQRRKEVAICLYSQMFRKMPECRKIFLKGTRGIEGTAVVFLSMLGWLIIQLHEGNANVWLEIKKLGKLHRDYGISHEHFAPMLQAIQVTFLEKFGKTFTLRVKFCIENLFMNASRIMTGKDFICLFAERNEDFESLEFLESMELCLVHTTGREYFEIYLQQTFNAEYVIFLKGFDEFKQISNIQQRYEKATEIYNRCFDPLNADAPMELKKEQESHIKELKNKLSAYKEHESLDLSDKKYELKNNLLDVLYTDIKEIMEEQNWAKFRSAILSIIEATKIKHIVLMSD